MPHGGYQKHHSHSPDTDRTPKIEESPAGAEHRQCWIVKDSHISSS